MAATPTIDQIGVFPADGEQARKDRVFYKLSDETAIKMISGRKMPCLINLWASNDVMQFGTIKLQAGGPGPWQTEYDAHKGDAVFHVLHGPMTFYVKERHETYDVQEGDFMFIPEGETYKIINYTAQTIEAVFAIAPQL